MKKLIIIVFLYAGLAIGQDMSKKPAFNQNDIFLPSKELAIKVKQLESWYSGEEMEIWYYALAVKYAREKNISKSIEEIHKIQDDKLYAQSARIVMDFIDPAFRPDWKAMIKERLDKAEDIVAASKGYYELAEVFGRILLQNNEYKEALFYTEQAVNNHIENINILRNYHYLLSVNKRYSEALPHLEKLVRTGFADDAVKSELLLAYQFLHPDKDTAHYMSNLRGDLTLDLKGRMADMEINTPVRDFTVFDLSGKEVSIKDFKGKTVVIDIWASWCMPCLAALPAMQRAAEKHRSDPSVKFMFINSLEKGDARTIAHNYFKEHNYEMDLYIDPMNPETKTSPAFEALDAHGLPSKIVIDASGIIRFKTGGFNGGDDELVEEINIMIEIAKQMK